jgi:hypothetical protein
MPDPLPPATLAEIDAVRREKAEKALASEGGMWSLLRDLMSQGADIWLDAQSYEAYSARLDAAARERTAHLWPALLASHAALEQRAKDAEQAAEDLWHHLLTTAEQRVRDLEGAIDCACNALTDSIMASGNDARTNLHWVNKLRGYLRGTGEGK